MRHCLTILYSLCFHPQRWRIVRGRTQHGMWQQECVVCAGCALALLIWYLIRRCTDARSAYSAVQAAETQRSTCWEFVKFGQLSGMGSWRHMGRCCRVLMPLSSPSSRRRQDQLASLQQCFSVGMWMLPLLFSGPRPGVIESAKPAASNDPDFRQC